MKYVIKIIAKSSSSYKLLGADSKESLINGIQKKGYFLSDAEVQKIEEWLDESFHNCKLYCLNFILERTEEYIPSDIIVCDSDLGKEISVRLNFTWDDEDDMKEFFIKVPKNISKTDVLDLLIETHNFLCHEDQEDIYGINGRNPETLIGFVCKKKGWKWSSLEYDVGLNLN